MPTSVKAVCRTSIGVHKVSTSRHPENIFQDSSLRSPRTAKRLRNSCVCVYVCVFACERAPFSKWKSRIERQLKENPNFRCARRIFWVGRLASEIRHRMFVESKFDEVQNCIDVIICSPCQRLIGTHDFLQLSLGRSFPTC